MSRQSTPHDHDAERSVLGACMLDARALDEVLTLLRPEDFHDRRNRECFEAARSLSADSKPVDETTVGAELKRTGKLEGIGGEYLARLTEEVPTATNARFYALIVRDASSRRAILDASRVAANDAIESEDSPQVIADRAAALMSAAAVRNGDRFSTPARDLVREEIGNMERLASGSAKDRGLRTGFYDLDNRLAGLAPGSLTLVAARPSMGKTALATNMMVGAAELGAKSLFFSLEMNKTEVAQRLIASEACVDLNALRNGKLSTSDWSKTMRAADRVHRMSLDIATPATVTILELRAMARKWRADNGGLDLVLVDYLQLMRGSGKRYEREEQEISEISRGLKALARELDIPVIALAQLNRQCEARPDKRPMLSDLRGSGSLEQDTDVVLFIYRDEYYHEDTQCPGVAEIIVAKNRNGARGGRPVLLRWSDAQTRFDNISDRPDTGQMSFASGDEP